MEEIYRSLEQKKQFKSKPCSIDTSTLFFFPEKQKRRVNEKLFRFFGLTLKILKYRLAGIIFAIETIYNENSALF